MFIAIRLRGSVPVASTSPSPRKNDADAGPLVVRTTAAEFARRYVLGRELGRGEFGVTRRCRDDATGEALACKTILRHRRLRSGDGPGVRRPGARAGNAAGVGPHGLARAPPTSAVQQDAAAAVHAADV